MFSVVAAYLPYAFVTAYTPGPNNILSLYSVGQKGWKKGKNTLFGIAAGFFSVMVVCAVLCFWMARYIPSLSNVLKYVGAAYILWLAVHIALSKPSEEGVSGANFWKAFFLQFANVKIIMYAITIYTGYVLPVSQSFPYLAAHAVCITVIGASGAFVWGAAGGALQRFLSKYYRPFNILMGVVLFICAMQIILS